MPFRQKPVKHLSAYAFFLTAGSSIPRSLCWSRASRFARTSVARTADGLAINVDEGPPRYAVGKIARRREFGFYTP